MMRPLRALTAVALLVVLCAGAGGTAYAQLPPPPPQPGVPAPTQAPPGPVQPTPPADPRVTAIRTGLEREKLRPLEVRFFRAEANKPASWLVLTAATYAQPTRPKVLQQSFTMWGVTYGVVAQDPPQTVLMTGQVWTKFIILLAVQISDYGTLLSGLRAARTDQEKDQAFTTFLRSIRSGVFDLEKQQFVDEKDFMNKNFGT